MAPCAGPSIEGPSPATHSTGAEPPVGPSVTSSTTRSPRFEQDGRPLALLVTTEEENGGSVGRPWHHSGEPVDLDPVEEDLVGSAQSSPRRGRRGLRHRAAHGQSPGQRPASPATAACRADCRRCGGRWRPAAGRRGWPAAHRAGPGRRARGCGPRRAPGHGAVSGRRRPPPATRPPGPPSRWTAPRPSGRWRPTRTPRARPRPGRPGRRR